MLFDSLEFLIFLPTVIILFYLIPHKYRWIFLLLASYFFYGSWKIEFLILIIYSTIVDYFVALKIDATQEKKRKRIWLSISLISNFGVLFIFKYFNFFIGTRNFFRDFAGQHPKVEWFTSVLEYGIPVGISFYTFQTVGYTLDVYFGKIKPQKNLAKFALFVSYFPQLVAGPIERFKNLNEQIFKKVSFQYENLSAGFRLILMGLFIKMVIADNLAPWVQPVFDNPLLYNQIDNIIATLFFSLQIYADFGGYSLIAIGLAKMMGVQLMDNFKTPYFSTSIKEFWSRWHISLSTWFRDYLYIPLGGNQANYFRWMINILIVFIVSGIWHGANFTFIVWGAIHGLFYLFENGIAKKFSLKKNLVLKIIGWVKTFIVVNIAWVFFRSDSLASAYLTLSKIFGSQANAETYTKITQLEKSNINPELINHFDKIDFENLSIQPILFVLIGFFILMDIWIKQSRIDIKLNASPFYLRWTLYAVLIFSITALSGSEFYQFIYFQF